MKGKSCVKIALLALLCVLLSGCHNRIREALVPLDIAPAPTLAPAASSPMPSELDSLSPGPELISPWLNMVNDLLRLDPEQAKNILAVLPAALTPRDHFQQALLHQQRNVRDGWIVARDGFRQLLEKTENSDQQGLLRVLLAHNQAMINAHQREQTLYEREAALAAREQLTVQRLQASLEREQALEAKIVALTNLEKRLNIRKENDLSATKLP